MADSPPKLLPAPLPRVEFLKASHFKIGPDPRLQEGCMKTTFGSLFPAHWDVHVAAPFLPGPSKGLFHEDLEKIREINTEMHTAFPIHDIKSFQSSISPPIQSSHLKMQRDPRINVFKTTCQEKYTYPAPEAFNPFIKEARRMFDKDSFPSGDRDKLRIPLSHNRQVYMPQHQLPYVRAPSLHLGGPSPLKWGMEPYPETSYQKEFQEKDISPAQLCEKLTSQLNLGDSRIGLEGIRSEQKNAYTPQGLPKHRYNKEEAAANIFQVNIKPGDGYFHAYLPGWKDMASVDTSEPVFKQQVISDSLLLKEDQDPERCWERGNHTTHNSVFTWPKDGARERPIIPKCHVIFGEKKPKLKAMVTMNQKYFTHPKPSSSRVVRSRFLLESNVKLGTNEMDFLTTSRQLGPHSVKKNPVPEEIKERVKWGHILPPQPDHEFSTEYKDNYLFKYVGPLVLQKNNFQESSVPLGSQKCWSEKKVVIPC